MNTYKSQQKGINLFHHLNQDVPVAWIWTIKDVLLTVIISFFVAAAEYYMSALTTMLVFGVAVPVSRQLGITEKVVDAILPRYFCTALKFYKPQDGEHLKD